MGFIVNLAKESFKFSGTHFTIFGPDKGERLHGHNYQVRARIELESLQESLGMAFDFNLVKPLIKEICESLDEYVLLPEKSPYLRIESDDRQVRVRFHAKEYVFPAEDVCRLPLVNITSEELARHFCRQLAQRLRPAVAYKRVSVTVEETRGQSVSYSEER